ncbi:MAG: SAM-dependent methyltransferase [Prevotellaceae bacterium]|jgi:16S rRNA G966 N2-methylase RsmD|nr:SAM-dependent methyltransferase [Prevotellaceae bacterium]
MKLSPELKLFVEKHEGEDVHSLALQARKFPGIDMNLAIRQIVGRKIAKEKIPTWYANADIVYPAHLSLEQSSSEATALYKTKLSAGEVMVDLTGGMGVDISFLAQRFKQATYVEQQTELSEIARHNFRALGLENIEVVNADGVEYLTGMQPVDLIYIDPARRDNVGKKTVGIEDCTPNVGAKNISPLLVEKAKTVIIKLSPMLDISLALKSLKNVAEVHIVAVNNEVKELLFIQHASTTFSDRVNYHCVNIQKNNIETFTFNREDESNISVHYTSELQKYLYEPNAAIMKGGAYKSIARAYNLKKLHPSSHLYTSGEFYPDFPGRKFMIKNVTRFGNVLRLDKANITVRNFPLSVAGIRKKTGLKEGGDTYIFATTLADERKVLIIAEKN